MPGDLALLEVDIPGVLPVDREHPPIVHAVHLHMLVLLIIVHLVVNLNDLLSMMTSLML